MKTIFKFMMLTTLGMGLATTAMAQTGAQQTITVNAKVLKPIRLSGIANLAFGGVFSNAAPFLDPKGQSSANVGFSSSVGTVVVDATNGEPIRVEFPDSVHLLNGTNRIAYVPIISAIYDSVTVDAASRAASGLLPQTYSADTTSAVFGNTTGNGRGPFGIFITRSGTDKTTLFIGGHLGGSSPALTVPPAQIPSNQPTGTYTGSLRLNFLYAL